MKNRARSTTDKQEEYIQYLYSVIDILKQKLRDAETQCKEYSGKLRHSEKICDDKEKFILFRESQLLELEDTIDRLKRRISFLSNRKMSAGSRRESRSRSRSQSRAELVSLDTTDNARLLEKVGTSVDELFQYATGERRLENVEKAQHLRDVIARASTLFVERHDAIEAETIDDVQKVLTENAELGEENLRLVGEVDHLKERIRLLSASVDGVNVELDNMERELTDIVREKDEIFYEYQNGVRTILEEYWQLEPDDELLYELERNLDWNRRELARRDDVINYVNNQLETCRQERDDYSRHYRAEQILTRRLKREKRLLKMTKRQLQIELLNAPGIAPAPPQPQPIDQIWLLLQ